MTLSMCDQVTERVALGEPLGELSEHVSTCSSCQGLVAVSSHLGSTHHAVDPGLGFSARMTVGAQHRLSVRRRHRLAAGLAATVATGAFGVFIVAHTPGESTPPTPTVAVPRHDPGPPDEQPAETPEAADADLAALVQLADVDRSSRLSAHWGHIKKPLAAYKKLQKQLKDEEGDAP
jgi:hypothetical protein